MLKRKSEDKLKNLDYRDAIKALRRAKNKCRIKSNLNKKNLNKIDF